MADDKQRTEELKKKAADERSSLEKVQTEQRQRRTGKPTPTQEELDAHMLGATITEHEPDGSAVEDPLAPQNKDLEPHRGGGYDTRSMHPAPTPQPQPARRHTPASE